MSSFGFSRLTILAALLLVFSFTVNAQKPLFVTQTPISGNSGNSFFVFLPMENAGSGEATNIQLKSVSLTFLGQSAATATQPSSLPFVIGFAAPAGIHVLDLEFNNSALIAGNRYMLTVNGSYEANGLVSGFQLNRPIIYEMGFNAGKDQVLSIIDAKFDALPNIDPAADDDILVAFLKGLPQVSDAGSQADPPLVWVKFMDGSQDLQILNDIKLPPVPVSQSVTSPKLAPTSAVSEHQNVVAEALVTAATSIPLGSSPELPRTNQIRILSETDPGFPESASDIKPWLEANGYKQAANADGSVAGLRSVGGDGVLYIGSHGGISKGDNSFFIVTSDPELTYCDPNDRSFGKTPCPDPLLPLDIENGRIIATKARQHFDPKTKTYVTYGSFAITKDFVDVYWGVFANNALVYIDACHSDQDDPSVQAFKDVIFNKKNASVYVGWSNTVGSNASADTTRLLFDRLLGANQFCPEDGAAECSTGPAEPPVFAQRPFDYTQVEIDLPKHGLGSDTKPNATLRFERNGNFAVLAPSISNMTVDETKGPAGQLTIKGMFGTDPRSVAGGSDADAIVTVGGPSSPVDIVSWASDRIAVKLTSSGPGSSGDVQVTVRKHKSNVARLTEWGGQFTGLWIGNDSLRQSVDLSPTFRVDLRKYRPVIHFPPVEPAGVQFLAMSSPVSTGNFHCSGVGTYAIPGGTATFTWTGSGNLPLFQPLEKGSPPPFFSSFLGFLTSGTSMEIGLGPETSKTFPCQYNAHIVLFSPPCSGNCVSDVPGGLIFCTGFGPGPVTLNPDTATIQGMTLPIESIPCSVPQPGGKSTFSWANIPPLSDTQPDPKSAR